jgi:hypothetical protein
VFFGLVVILSYNLQISKNSNDKQNINKINKHKPIKVSERLLLCAAFNLFDVGVIPEAETLKFGLVWMFVCVFVSFVDMLKFETELNSEAFLSVTSGISDEESKEHVMFCFVFAYIFLWTCPLLVLSNFVKVFPFEEGIINEEEERVLCTIVVFAPFVFVCSFFFLFNEKKKFFYVG